MEDWQGEITAADAAATLERFAGHMAEVQGKPARRRTRVAPQGRASGFSRDWRPSRLKPLLQGKTHAFRAGSERVRGRQHPGGGEFH